MVTGPLILERPAFRQKHLAGTWCLRLLLAAAVLPGIPWVPASASDRAAAVAPIAVSVHDGLLSLSAIEAPLSEVVARIGEAGGFRVVVKQDLDEPVTWRVTDMPAEKALRRLLAGRSYVLWYETAGDATGVTELRLLRGLSSEAGFDITVMNRPPTLAKSEDRLGTAITLPDNSDHEARLSFAREMAQRPQASAVEGLGTLLAEDQDPMIRRIAAIGLGKTGGRAALEALFEGLQDEDPSVRRRVIQGLGKKKDESAVDALNEVLLGDSDAEMRRAAVRSLGSMGTQEAYVSLTAGENDPDYYVRREAGLALDRMRERGDAPEN